MSFHPAEQLRVFATGVQFLTRIPVPKLLIGDNFDPARLGRSTVYFPLVGLLVGGLAVLVFVLSSRLWGAPLPLMLALLSSVVVTGGFHEDGLADAADGLGGSLDRRRSLEIMKDSRLGTFGALAVVWLTLLKLGALSLLPVASVGAALIAGHVLGRWSSLPLIFACEYVRPPTETAATGRPFAEEVNLPRLAVGSGVAILILFLALSRSGLPVLATSAILIGICGAYFRRRLGGITGDCLGAANQVVELGTYLVLAVGS